ncbi:MULTISPECIES: lytic murein transglycosylase B [Rahnella]|jgi:membrane-bound lytic murein transglycosylase B|uniref:Lytic murein transglycosylase B n=1 Tax=Rahnella contaminans TaxID=2703882 RepID=A0A6M2BAG1_9GAMM|nr:MULTISPECIES: lytic murein transglycosylase B [Rahnella]MBU9822748.1 lytic murein transglycosylase B [Rahnella sp. BCC 1045]MCS3425950.1 membrane-bound lytic murein transglycosylase B [Rahnella sp. BIGb0603]MDF1895695.1 lytic murein transglycosylase B [Rahnella contaminans]NGX89541.1 lytic murein transglycosylase B [Rahnella contaminans]
MRLLAVIIPLVLTLSACSSNKPPAQPEGPRNPFSDGRNASGNSVPSGGFLLQPEHTGAVQSGDFAYDPAMNRFVDKMVSEHGFDRQQLHDVLAQTKRLGFVLRLMDQQAPSGPPSTVPNGAWNRYRSKFITPDNVQNGVVFWNQYQDALQRAEQVYGVPPEIIVGIIGVETRWGRVMGKTRIIDALATLSFAYPRRADYFSGELETFLLMSRREGDDPLSLRGSFAGAMGYGQFMPSSYKDYAVDFNGDGHANLWDPIDAIGSVANYFKAHGWTKGAPIAVPAAGQAPLLENGFKTKYPLYTLTAAGLSPLGSLGGYQEASLLRLDMGTSYQYWYGLPNFYTITRYNHSVHYAMAVWQLGEAVKAAR